MRHTALLFLVAMSCKTPPEPGETDDTCVPTTEVCNDIDDDCDGFVDNHANDGTTTFLDVDGDGYGDGNTPWRLCEVPDGRVEDGRDCDDADASVYPGTEDCDGFDSDADTDADSDSDTDSDTDADTDADTDTDTEPSDDADQDGYAEDDCDDNDASIFPGAHEPFGDGVDSDCIGGDAAAFEDGGHTWVEARNVVVARDAWHWNIVTGATRTDFSPNGSTGLSLVFDASFAVEPIDAVTWHVPQTLLTTQTLGPRIDADTGTDGYYVAATYTNAPTSTSGEPPPPSTFVIAKRVYWDTLSPSPDYRTRMVYRQISTIAETLVDVDLRAPPNGDVTTFACGPTMLAYVVGDASASFDYVAKGCYGAGNCSEGTLAPSNPTSCFVEPSNTDTLDSLGTVCNGVTCTSYTLPRAIDATVSVAPEQRYAMRAWRTQESRGDWVVRTSGSGVEYFGPSGSGTALAGHDVTDAEIYEHAGRVYIAAVVKQVSPDGTAVSDVAVAWGTPGTAFNETVFPAERASGRIDVRSAAIAVESSVGLLAVSGAGANGDTVAWQWIKLE